ALDPATPAPRLGEVKPPLRVDDGMIEVGWEAEAEPAAEPAPAPPPPPPPPPGAPPARAPRRRPPPPHPPAQAARPPARDPPPPLAAAPAGGAAGPGASAPKTHLSPGPARRALAVEAGRSRHGPVGCARPRGPGRDSPAAARDMIRIVKERVRVSPVVRPC